MNVRRSLAFPLTAIVLTFFATPIGAAPVTSGFMAGSANSDFAAHIDLAGDGFALRCSGHVKVPNHLACEWGAKPTKPVGS
jgi:hypothetical protein